MKLIISYLTELKTRFKVIIALAFKVISSAIMYKSNMRKCQLQLNPFPYWVNPVAQLFQTWYVPKIYFNVLLNKLRYFGRQHASTNNDDDVCIFSLQVYRLMIWLMHFTFCWDWFIGKSLWQTLSSLYQIVCSKTISEMDGQHFDGIHDNQ